MSNDFSFCPKCGKPTVNYIDNKKWVCSSCGFTLYNNVAASATLIIMDTDGSIIFEKRAKEPKRGFLTMPGGFIDLDESAEEACRRECLEETGIEPDSIEYVASFPNTYIYKDITYKTCDTFFAARFDSLKKEGKKLTDLMKKQETEVQEFVNIKIETPQDLDNLNIAFESHAKAIKVWLKNRGK